ncbi:uncharacterized protein LOC107883508 [Acyrthosiphon pisum]|uniref:Gustatory receptor n=1 Tax=Acyrthosiphon pisum TaxID=7029 RepID=A0A8R2D3K4_ACYPI|nr:uncharacterized protein LOC107883508 [Acyrthosiphon pisum]|eukprot:XP_016659147.1 PREDICTED: uncharacterized protein LOC107883508 [Acyrthosiphon pisum]
MLYLKYFGAIFFDSNNDNDMCQIVYSVVLFITGIIMAIMSPYVVLEFDDWSEAFSMSMSLIVCTIVNISSCISRMIVKYNVKFKYQKYKTTLEGFEIYIPTNTVALKHIKYFSFVVISWCMSVIIPINGLKMYYIFNNHVHPILMTTYFFFYYMHNLSMVCTELHFAIQCFVVYTKFRDIHDKLIQINDEQNYYNYNVRYPFTVNRMTPKRNDATSPCDIIYEKDFYCSKDKVSPLANTIELLRIKYWLTQEAVNDLNGLFGFQMGLSIICLTTLILFDIYTEVFYSRAYSAYYIPVFRSKFLFVGWMLQYSSRICIIIFTAHTATKQVVKIKKLIAEMNNRYLDCSTKEELRLFYYQLSICPSEFTIFNTFTINNGIITSAIAAGSTYILILVQIHSKK